MIRSQTARRTARVWGLTITITPITAVVVGWAATPLGFHDGKPSESREPVREAYTADATPFGRSRAPNRGVARLNFKKSGALPAASGRSASTSAPTTPSTPSHRLPGRVAIPLHLEADLRIGICPKHPVSLSLENRVVRVSQGRGGVENRGGALPRVELRGRGRRRDSGEGNG
jgi:hypothetical protein